MPEYLQPRRDGFAINVKVTPRASRNEVGGAVGNEVKIKVTAPPVDSAANEAVLELLAEILACPRNALELLRGHASRHKQILVKGLSAEEVVERIDAAVR